jgi:hypothetical protein
MTTIVPAIRPNPEYLTGRYKITREHRINTV